MCRPITTRPNVACATWWSAARSVAALALLRAPIAKWPWHPSLAHGAPMALTPSHNAAGCSFPLKSEQLPPMVTQGQGTPISIFPRRTGGRGTSPHPPKKCFKMLHLFHFISEVWDTWQALGTLLGREKRCFGTLWARLVQGFRRCRLGYVGAFARRVCPWRYVSTCVRGDQ